MGRGVAALSLKQRQRSDINMSISNWRDGEICDLLTIMGEKGMQSHSTKSVKDGVIYEKVPGLPYKAFVGIKTSGQQIKNMLAFLHL